jgi:transcriptional regulator with XRE-family HTH domain
MDTSTSLSRLLRDLRYRRSLTQRELAHLSGVDQRRISSYERGRRKVPLRHADQILAGLGLQLRLETERLWADVDAKIDELAALPIAERLIRSRVLIPELLRWLAVTEPVIDGCAAALLQGAPVPVDWVDLCVRRDKLDNLAEALRKRPDSRWSEAKGWWADHTIDPRLPGPMRWHHHLGEFRITIVDTDPPTITLVVDDERWTGLAVRVRPLADLEVDDVELSRVLARMRERQRGGDGGS